MYKMNIFLLALVVLSGSIDMAPVSITPYRNTYPSRYGYTMPSQGDYLVAAWAVPCTDFMVVTGAGDAYNNTMTVLFFRNGQQVGQKTLVFQPWAELSTTTEFVYDTAVFINWDGPADSVVQPWCWWHY